MRRDVRFETSVDPGRSLVTGQHSIRPAVIVVLHFFGLAMLEDDLAGEYSLENLRRVDVIDRDLKEVTVKNDEFRVFADLSFAMIPGFVALSCQPLLHS